MHTTTKGLIAFLTALALACTVGCPSGEASKGESGDKKDKDGEKEGGDEAKSGDKGPKSPEDVPKELKSKDIRDSATLVLPSPDQFLTVMAILGKPKFDKLVDPVEKIEYDSKSQTAIVSGIVLAHFFVHVHAKDSEKAQKALDDVIKMSKALKIKTPEKEVKKVRKRLKKKQWAQLRQDFLDLNTELQNDLIKTQRKPDLAILISLGAYLEGANMGAKIIIEDYSKERAELLRQSGLIKEIKRSSKKTLDEDDKYVKLMLKNLGKLQKVMDVPDDESITKEKAEEIQKLAAKTKKKLLEG